MQDVNDPHIRTHNDRPILSIARLPSLSTEDIEAIEGTLARGSVDLTQLPLDDLLKRFAQNREDRRLIHIDISICAVKDCFAAVKNGQVDAREKAFRDSPKGESTGHYLYRFFVVKCEFSKSKATKISTYLEGLVREGLDPAEIRKQMVKNWTLEDGYNEALRARDETEADDYDDDEADDPTEPGGKSSKKARRATKGSPSSDDCPPSAFVRQSGVI